MRRRVREYVEGWYARLLQAEISDTPEHVAVIQDGNRRYARNRGEEPSDGHEEGAKTSGQLLEWCEDLDIKEITVYAFSTENFDRSKEERETLFDLISEKLRDFADDERVHEAGIRIRAVGERHRLPPRVRDAITYAERKTADYDEYHLNIALAYGGRAELLGATREIAADVEGGTLDPDDVDVETVESALYDGPTRDVDLIVRSGGDERTSNFLPWRANGNEAAVYFSTPYWPEFRKIDFLRGIRTYENRGRRRQESRLDRATAVLRLLGRFLGISRVRTQLRRVLGGSPASRGTGPGDPEPIADTEPVGTAEPTGEPDSDLAD